MNHITEMVLVGEFADGAPAYRIRALESFTIHGQTVKAGSMTMARFDDNCDIRLSWVWGEGEIRNVHLNMSMIGRQGAASTPAHSLSNAHINSCSINCEQMAVSRVDLNAVNTKRIKFFGALGNENSLVLSDVNYSLSVRMYNTPYSEFKEYMDKVTGNE